MITQQDVAEALEVLAPAHLAEEWDNVGWQVRGEASVVTGVLCAVDATEGVMDEAVSAGANVVLAHHPILFRPLRSVDTRTRIGAIVTKAIRREISIIAAHTNWDSAPGGISWALANELGLRPITPLLPAEGAPGAGLGIVAESEDYLSADTLIGRVRDQLHSPVVSLVGTGRVHQRIALMGGSGSAGIARAAESGATLYITADVRYHEAQEAQALGLSLLVIDHGASERPGMAELARRLESRMGAPITISQTPTSPWRLLTDATD